MIYTYKQITNILLMRDGRVTEPKNLREFDGHSRSEVFNLLNIKTEPVVNPRALSKAVFELQGLGYSDNEINDLVFPVLNTAQDIIENKIQIKLKRKIFSESEEIKRIVMPYYNGFLGVQYKFMLFTQNITDRVDFDKEQLEKMVEQDLVQKIYDLSVSKPELFDKGPPGMHHGYVCS
jgi:hypothetical protein